MLLRVLCTPAFPALRRLGEGIIMNLRSSWPHSETLFPQNKTKKKSQFTGYLIMS